MTGPDWFHLPALLRQTGLPWRGPCPEKRPWRTRKALCSLLPSRAEHTSAHYCLESHRKTRCSNIHAMKCDAHTKATGNNTACKSKIHEMSPKGSCPPRNRRTEQIMTWDSTGPMCRLSGRPQMQIVEKPIVLKKHNTDSL